MASKRIAGAESGTDNSIRDASNLQHNESEK
jgi:hypothetical protein